MLKILFICICLLCGCAAGKKNRTQADPQAGMAVKEAAVNSLNAQDGNIIAEDKNVSMPQADPEIEPAEKDGIVNSSNAQDENNISGDKKVSITKADLQAEPAEKEDTLNNLNMQEGDNIAGDKNISNYVMSVNSKEFEQIAKADLAEIKKSLRKAEKPIAGRLKNNYSLGYAIFYFDGSRIIYDNGNIKFNIDWSSTKLIRFTGKKLLFRVPDWEYANKNGFNNMIVALERKIGTKYNLIYSADLKAYIECISTNSKSTIVVIGFSAV